MDHPTRGSKQLTSPYMPSFEHQSMASKHHERQQSEGEWWQMENHHAQNLTVYILGDWIYL